MTTVKTYVRHGTIRTNLGLKCIKARGYKGLNRNDLFGGE